MVRNLSEEGLFKMNVSISMIQLVYKFILLSEMGQEEVAGGKGLPMKDRERGSGVCMCMQE
jgi:hypothetical protein